MLNQGVRNGSNVCDLNPYLFEDDYNGLYVLCREGILINQLV